MVVNTAGLTSYQARMLVTGVILAAYGQLGEDGTFQVDELQNPGLPPQIPTGEEFFC